LFLIRSSAIDKIPERRKYVRIEKPYITHFRVKPCDGEASNNWDTVAVVNLSAGGLFFYSKIDLEVGTILDLGIGFSHIYPSVLCVGRVIRAKRHPDASKIGYTIEFTEIGELDKIIINKSLEIAKWQQGL
jgi:hypothetical protein